MYIYIYASFVVLVLVYIYIYIVVVLVYICTHLLVPRPIGVSRARVQFFDRNAGPRSCVGPSTSARRHDDVVKIVTPDLGDWVVASIKNEKLALESDFVPTLETKDRDVGGDKGTKGDDEEPRKSPGGSVDNGVVEEREEAISSTGRLGDDGTST